MKVHYSFIFFLLMMGMNLSAQQTKLILPSIQSQQHSSAFELINLTGDSSIIGYLTIDSDDNDRQAIVTPVDKGEWMQNITAAQTYKAMEGAGQSILYILHDISVGRTTGGNYARIKAAIYAGNSKGFALTRQVDTLVTDEAEDISSVGRLIAKAVAATGQVGLPAHNTPGLATGPEATRTRDEVIQAETDRYAFLRRSANPTGIYMSYEEFKNGKPAFEHFYLKSEDESSSLIVHSFTETDSTLRPVEPWEIAVSNEIYFYSNHKLYPVEAVGNNLVFSKFIDPEIRKNNAAFWRMTIGDKIKGRASNVFDNINTLVLSDYRGQKLTGEAVRINADTGAAEW